ncbi:hypothetical protein JCM19301_3533 [Jejuia pallidilutea]|uniref:Uncharacterized protein n=1 Tax=Jejuia pallidilutea TaxID=504487 RepID=A0A090VP81_9FLAO|nr:hypothetical protein JCM19301_3533 [Jejuia pallidilutea]GAL71478.1 hypothetical protein JCM19302_1647 [Jejuia pallidilutea]GAL88511.1 hypothetical protein JCM19538_3024 [Jejuia pallidilutea]
MLHDLMNILVYAEKKKTLKTYVLKGFGEICQSQSGERGK